MRRRRLVHRYRSRLEGLTGVSVPYSGHEVDHSSCYVMPLMLDDPDVREPLRQHMLERHKVQTSVLYPAIHEFSAYADSGARGLERSELAARTELTLPLFPDLSEAEQDRVLAALEQGLTELGSSLTAPAARTPSD